MSNQARTGTFVELEDGTMFVIEDGAPIIEYKYRLGYDITKEPYQYAVIASYERKGEKYAYVNNDPRVLEKLLELQPESDIVKIMNNFKPTDPQ